MNSAHQPPIPIILRRAKPYRPLSATATTTATPSSPSTSSSTADFELVSIKPTSYTSLRDILPSSPTTVLQSPKSPLTAANLGYEISFRDRLVKQAAWAYLRPMSTSPEPDGTTVFRRMWTRFSGTLRRIITTTFDCLLLSIHV